MTKEDIRKEKERDLPKLRDILQEIVFGRGKTGQIAQPIAMNDLISEYHIYTINSPVSLIFNIYWAENTCSPKILRAKRGKVGITDSMWFKYDRLISGELDYDVEFYKNKVWRNQHWETDFYYHVFDLHPPFKEIIESAIGTNSIGRDNSLYSDYPIDLFADNNLILFSNYTSYNEDGDFLRKYRKEMYSRNSSTQKFMERKLYERTRSGGIWSYHELESFVTSQIKESYFVPLIYYQHYQSTSGPHFGKVESRNLLEEDFHKLLELIQSKKTGTGKSMFIVQKDAKGDNLYALNPFYNPPSESLNNMDEFETES